MTLVFYPSELKFAQDSISSSFRDGRTLEESLRSLLNEKRPASVLPRMLVMHHNGEYFVSDGNRRLFLLKLLEKEGLVGKVKVYLTFFNDIKYTTTNNGMSVRVRGNRNMKLYLKSIIWNRHDQTPSRGFTSSPVYTDYNRVSSPSVNTDYNYPSRMYGSYHNLETSSSKSDRTSSPYSLNYTKPQPAREEKSSSWGCTIL